MSSTCDGFIRIESYSLAGRDMKNRPHLQGDLRAVAFIHLLMGVGALVEVVVRLTQNYYQLNLGVLGIPICFGLLCLVPGWPTCALVLLWIGLLLVPIVGLAGVAGSGPATFGVLGVPLGVGPRGWLSVVAVAMFPFLLWQYRGRVRPGVRRLFILDRAPANKTQQPTGAPSGAGD